MYTSINFKTKKAVKDAIARGREITVYQPNDMFGRPEASPTYTGSVTLEGPWYPEPHKWYGTGQVVNGRLVNIK